MEDGWDTRAAAEMESTRNSRVERRPKGFYTADKCKEQLARIMAEPCPSEVPTGAEYSRAAIVDEWIKHYSEQERQDAAMYGQFMNVKIRSYEERLLAAWGHREKFTTEQVEAMLEGIKKEEEEMSSDDEEAAKKHERVGDIYYKHVADLFYKQKQKAATSPPSASRQSSSVSSDQKLNDVETQQDSPDTSTALKSPIKETLHEISGDVHLENLENDQEEKMEVDDPGASFEVAENSMSSPPKDLSQTDHNSKRPRGRPPKKDSSTPTRELSPSTSNISEEAKSPTRSETLRSGGRSSEPSTTPVIQDKDAIQVIDSPAGRVRGARRPAAVDSTIITKAPNSGRLSSTTDIKDVKEGNKERETAKRRHSSDVGSSPTLSPLSTSLVDESGGTATQTAVSIHSRVCPGSDSGAVPSRKSSRHDRRNSNATSAVSTGSNRCDIAVQTDQVKIDSDENISVQSPLSEMLMIPISPSSSINIDSDVAVKAAHCENDQTSRVVVWDDILNSNLPRKSYRVNSLEDRTQLFEVSYSDFSEQAWDVAKNFALSKSLAEKSTLSLCVCSPSKRMRKEEKSGSVLTPKGRMVSTWNLLHEHRHSAIFLHPVTDRDAPGYSCVVNCPADLTTLKKEIDSGAIVNPILLMRKVFMMFTNAVIFNSTGHDVNFYAKEMCKDTLTECCFTMDPRMDAYRVHHRRSRGEDARRRSTPTPTAASSRAPAKKKK
ncbi:hypothetical protein KIN20_026199 [Parelaphostrongylus tenuis]|uniref:Bromo domain-containing protein n=1 Tax=Parelaphostrongylus tenuis TaxID=148309 RepID=A0AAD5MZB9_PARTN|nr:hypothetical protein KIN20_026199 [Parelaphostrongylus tenuis]